MIIRLLFQFNRSYFALTVIVSSHSPIGLRDFIGSVVQIAPPDFRESRFRSKNRFSVFGQAESKPVIDEKTAVGLINRHCLGDIDPRQIYQFVVSPSFYQ